MKIKNLLFVAVFCYTGLFFLAGCKRTTATTDNPIVFDSVRVEKAYHLFNDEKMPACSISINFIYPKEYKNTGALKSMQNLFVGTLLGDKYEATNVQEAIDTYVGNYINEYKELETDYQDDLGMSAYTFEEIAGTSIEFNKGGILSFISTVWSYTGGAHGSTNIQAHIIDISSGTLINETDIFNDDTDKELSALIVKQLMVDYDVQTPEALVDAGFFDITEIGPNNNIIANEEGITFIYNAYEIAPYVMGPIQVLLSYAEINAYMKKNSPLSKFVN